MDKISKLTLVFALLVGHAVGQSTPEPYPRTVSVSATADTLVVPDVASFTIKEFRKDKQASVARDSVVFNINRAIDICRSYGLTNPEIHSDGLKTNRALNRRGAVVWYGFTQEVTFTFRNLDSLRKAVSELTSLGIEMSEVSWLISREKQIYRFLSELAVVAARQQAVLLAERIGQSIGPALKITDGSLESLRPNGRESFRGDLMGKTTGIRVRGLSEVTPTVSIEPGTKKLQFYIYIVFELKAP